MRYKLKHCPFACPNCDGKVKLAKMYNSFVIFSFNDCHIRMCSETVVDSNNEQSVLEKLIEKWNSRTDDEGLIEVECETAGFALGVIKGE